MKRSQEGFLTFQSACDVHDLLSSPAPLQSYFIVAACALVTSRVRQVNHSRHCDIPIGQLGLGCSSLMRTHETGSLPAVLLQESGIPAVERKMKITESAKRYSEPLASRQVVNDVPVQYCVKRPTAEAPCDQLYETNAFPQVSTVFTYTSPPCRTWHSTRLQPRRSIGTCR